MSLDKTQGMLNQWCLNLSILRTMASRVLRANQPLSQGEEKEKTERLTYCFHFAKMWGLCDAEVVKAVILERQ